MSQESKATTVAVDTSTLRVFGTRPPLFQYIKGVWERRHFIWRESRSHAFGQIKNTALGQAWLILDPFLSSAVYYIIFGVLLNFSHGVENFVGYLVIGVTCFAFLNNQLLKGMNLLENRKALMRSFPFPRITLVFSLCLQQLIDFFPTFVASLLFIVVIPPHSIPTWTWLLAPLVVLLAVPFGLGLACLSSAFTYIFPDFKFIWPLISRFWMYGSGIFWSMSMFANHPKAVAIISTNPGWQFLELLRELLVYNTMPEPWLWLQFTAWSFGIFLLGALFFWANEKRFGVEK